VAHACNFSHSGGRDEEDYDSKPDIQFTRSYLENTQPQNRAGRGCQVVEYLPSKYEALSSNPTAATKKPKPKTKLSSVDITPVL
jgi:hypothetical protein